MIDTHEINTKSFHKAGAAIWCYKRSMRNEPKKFFFHKDVNLKPNHLYMRKSNRLLFNSSEGKLMETSWISRRTIDDISDLLRSGSSVEEAINFLNL